MQRNHHLFAPEIEYLGYMLTKDGIKPVQKKVQAVLDLQPPTTLKQVRSFLGMVQFYRDMQKVMAKETILTYPNFNEVFEIHTDDTVCASG